MDRDIAIIGAASSIGIRPYDDGAERELHRAPARLRSLGLATSLGARDLGDVTPPPYGDFRRPAGRPRNEAGLVRYCGDLADCVAAAAADGTFVLVLGGDCSIVLGCLLGIRRRTRRPGLVYVDAHSDFATPQESVTGSVASMCAAMAVGRGDSALARLAPTPLVQPTDLAILGRRDDQLGDDYGQEALRALGVADVPDAALRQRGAAATARSTLERFASAGIDGFWIHVDADVLDPSVMPAVDSPEPGGLSPEDLIALVEPFAADPRAIGMEVTIYDPRLDPDGGSARTLATLLQHTLRPEGTA